MGESTINGGPVFIRGIEPQLDPHTRFIYSIDSSSIWLGVNIVPKASFEENAILFKEFVNWVIDCIYILRFLINLNLKAKIFFHVEIFQEGQEIKKISIQKDFDPHCNSSSTFHVNFNRYDLVFPLIIRLLNHEPTDNFKSLMYNYANANIGNSSIIQYFYSFAVFEGIIHNWAEENGFSELWGRAIATIEEQNTLHEELRELNRRYLTQRNLQEEKKNQLTSFIDSTFPTGRKIRRSLRQRLKSYMDERLPQNVRSHNAIQGMWAGFHRIYSRRNEIGHSLETYTREPGYIEDIEILLTSLKLLMDFEINNFIQGESDWKFEERTIQLRNIVHPLPSRRVLENFIINLNGENQTNIRLRSRSGFESIEKIEFHTEMEYIEEKISYERRLTIYYPQDFRYSRIDQQNSQRVVSIYPNPYFWLFTTIGNTIYLFKTFENRSYTHQGGSIYNNFPNDNILMFIRAESIEIPDNSNIFSEGDF